MKREDVISLIVYVLMILIAVLVGLFVISPLFTTYGAYLPGNGAANIGFAFLFVLVAIVFNVILFEISHVIGAKASGYQIISVNVLYFCFYRQNNKFKFRFANFDGLTGETKIAPNPEKKKYSPKLFALSPLIFYVIEVAVCFIVYYFLNNILSTAGADESLKSLSWLVILCIMIITIGGMLELYNIFPAKLDSLTDGYRLVILSKKENFEAYNELMRIEYAYSNNTPLDDMKIFESITDFTCQVNLYSVYKYLGQKDFVKAEEILDHMIESKKSLSKENYCSVLAQKMYIVLLTKPFEEARNFYDKYITSNEIRFISNDLSMQSIRAYLLISSMIDISEHEARYAISRVEKALKRTLAGRVDIEKALYEKALKKVDEVRPEWKIREKEII